MNKFVAILLVLVVIMGVIGGVSALGIGPLAPFLKPAEKEVVAEPLEEIEIPKAANNMPTEYYYDLGSIIVPIFDGKSISRQIEVELAIKVSSEAGGRISKDFPRLKNTVMLTLYDFLPSYVDKVTPESKKAVHDRLYKVLADKYGSDALLDVIVKTMRVR